MKRINLGPGLTLNGEDLIESAFAVLAKRGKGKSGLVKVLMEELVRASLPFVAFDPVGIMWGLRSSFDGSGPGLQVLVIGGRHADVAIDRRAGRDVAEAVVKANVSCVVDFSQEPKAAYREFVRDFCHTLFTVNDTPRFVILEEADELVPQMLRPDAAECFEAVERLVRRGRNQGIGVCMVTQRPAVISKNVLSQVDGIFVLGLVAPQDRKTIREWVEDKDQGDKMDAFMDGLKGLKTREAWFWASGGPFGERFERVRVKDFKTFHPDKTHLRKLGLLEVKPITTDVTKVVAALGTTMERLKHVKDEKATVAQLQAKISKIEKELGRKLAVTSVTSLTRNKPAMVALAEATKHIGARVKAEKERDALRAEILAHTKRDAQIQRRLETFADEIESAAKELRPRPKAVKEAVRVIEQVMLPKKTEPTAPKAVPEPAEPPEEGAVDIGPAYVKVLQAMAELEAIGVSEAPKAQVALFAERSPTSSTFQNMLGRLRTGGFIDYSKPGYVRLMDAGRDKTEPVSTPATTQELQERVARVVGPKLWSILAVLIEVYPNTIDRATLSERTNRSATSSTFQNNLGRLRSLGLVDYKDGAVLALPILFLEEA